MDGGVEHVVVVAGFVGLHIQPLADAAEGGEFVVVGVVGRGAGVGGRGPGRFGQVLSLANGQFAQAAVTQKVQANQFVITTSQPNVKVSWQVTGARRDKWALAHPINPEEPKTGAARGKYLLPELYGRPASEGIVPPPAEHAIPAK